MVQYIRLVCLALLLSMGVGSVALAGDTAFIKTFEIHQELPDFRFGYLEAVPSGTHLDINATDCPDFTIQKQDQRFELSGSIRKKGWPVIAEVQLAQYKFIAFAGKFKPNTSSTCEISQSNIAVFEDDELLGVIYLGNPEDALIGNLELMDAGFIRIYSGRFIWELVAELHLEPEGLRLITPISEFTAHCNGKAIVPNTLGENIADGREVMFKFGFTPIPFEQMPGSWTNEYFPGINELVGCSNGITFCGFSYENEHSQVWLTTIGDTEIVRNEVSCKK